MKTKIIIFSLATVTYLLSAFSCSLQAQQVGMIANNYVRVREQPNTSSKMLTYANNGDAVAILEKTGEKYNIGKMNDYWYRVRLENGTEGWVYGAFVKFPEQTEIQKSTEPKTEELNAAEGAVEIKANDVVFYEDGSKSKITRKIPFKKFNKQEQLNNIAKYGKDSYYIYNEASLTPGGALIKEFTLTKDSKITRLDFYDKKANKTGSIDVIFDYRVSPDFKYVVIMPAKGIPGYYGDKIVVYNSNGKFISQYDCAGVTLIYNQAFSENSDYFGLIRQNQDGVHEVLILNRGGTIAKQEKVEDSQNAVLVIKNDGSYILKKKNEK